MTAADVEDGSGGQQQQRTMTMVTANANNVDGRRQQQRMTTAANDHGTQDQEADYKGKGGERAANNNSIRARWAESVKKQQRNQVYAKRLFSAIQSVWLDSLLPPKHPTVPFRFISLTSAVLMYSLMIKRMIPLGILGICIRTSPMSVSMCFMPLQMQMIRM
jgi:hypothetical protein